MKTRHGGFSLIELMIVVAIIGILASVGIPAYQVFIARAQVTEAVNSIVGLKAELTSNYSTTGACPVNGQGGFGVPTDYAGIYIEKVEFSGPLASVPSSTCSITATFKSTGINQGLMGKTIVVAMTQTNTGNSQWEFSQSLTLGTVPTQLLPKSLR